MKNKSWSESLATNKEGDLCAGYRDEEEDEDG